MIIAQGAVPKNLSIVQPIPIPTNIATTNSVDSLMALLKLTLSDFFSLKFRFMSLSLSFLSSDFKRSSSGPRWFELDNGLIPADTILKIIRNGSLKFSKLRQKDPFLASIMEQSED